MNLAALMSASDNWVTISALATAGGTLVLAVATFASVRSANRAARVAERSFQINLRPIFAPSKVDDAPQRVMFGDHYWVTLEGGKAAVEVDNGVIYLAMMLRNVGNGIGIIEAWSPLARSESRPDLLEAPERFRDQQRDLWVPPGDVAFWQGALREPSEAVHTEITRAVEAGEINLDLRYRDYEGGQRMVSRFGLVRRDNDGDGSDDGWWTSLLNHRTLD